MHWHIRIIQLFLSLSHSDFPEDNAVLRVSGRLEMLCAAIDKNIHCWFLKEFSVNNLISCKILLWKNYYYSNNHWNNWKYVDKYSSVYFFCWFQCDIFRRVCIQKKLQKCQKKIIKNINWNILFFIFFSQRKNITDKLFWRNRSNLFVRKQSRNKKLLFIFLIVPWWNIEVNAQKRFVFWTIKIYHPSEKITNLFSKKI